MDNLYFQPDMNFLEPSGEDQRKQRDRNHGYQKVNPDLANAESGHLSGQGCIEASILDASFERRA